jgi:hypothetical protein
MRFCFPGSVISDGILDNAGSSIDFKIVSDCILTSKKNTALNYKIFYPQKQPPRMDL